MAGCARQSLFPGCGDASSPSPSYSTMPCAERCRSIHFCQWPTFHPSRQHQPAGQSLPKASLTLPALYRAFVKIGRGICLGL
jgi:hypothetical protein